MTKAEIDNACKDYENYMFERKKVGVDTFEYDNLKMFYKVVYFLRNGLEPWYDGMKFFIPRLDELSKADFITKIKISDDFFKQINYNVDVEKFVRNGFVNPFDATLDFKKISSYLKGHGQINKDNGDIVFPNSGFALDLLIMIHEFGHAANKTSDEKVKNILSEASALYVELQSYDYLSGIGYEREVKFMKSWRMKLLYEDSKKYLTILSALLSRKDVTFKGETDYYSLEMIKQEDFYKIEKMMNYMLGFPLAIYMYNMVKDDFSFSENINTFNKNLADFTFEQSLNVIGIFDIKKDLIEKIPELIETYENQRIKKMN